MVDKARESDVLTELVSGMAAAAMLRLVIGWAKEMGQAAVPLRGILGDESPVSEKDMGSVSAVLVTVLQALVLGKAQELDQTLEPFSSELDVLAKDRAEASCQCPKHQAARTEARGAGQPTA